MIVHMYQKYPEVLMKAFEENNIKKEGYQNMYSMYSISNSNDRFLCENNYLSNPKKTYLIKRPLT
tara:strand:+ start:58 stop:252 length:195 start_codon:yes stop_codon:yes gene_type:complete